MITMMSKEEAYKKLCVVLYNSIKEKLKAVNELNIYEDLMNKNSKYLPIIIAASSIVFVNILLPVLDSLSSMAISAVNKKVNKWAIDMELDKREADAAAETISPSPAITQAIGFQVNDDSYYEEEYE